MPPRAHRIRRLPAIVAAVTLGAAAVTATTTATTAVAASTVDHGSAAREQAFAAAATEFGVPAPLPEAGAYAPARRGGHAGQHHPNGRYGPMNLVDGTLFSASPTQQRDGVGSSTAVPAAVDSLGAAAALLGVDRDTLRQDAA